MRKKLRNGLVLGLSIFFALQVFPLGTLAQGETADTPSADTTTEEPSLEAEWQGTGALQDDGTPITAEEGDTAEASGAIQTLAEEPSVLTAEQPASYALTLDLDGGQVNTLQSAGWNQSTVQTYQWMRTLTESAAGQGISLTPDSTLGGLLPGAPYRAGYNFTGWKIGDTVYKPGTAQAIQIHTDTTVVAQWQIASYSVDFQANGSSLWSVEVPYGATLWTEPEAPWTADGLPWDGDTATVSVTLGGTPYNDVTVTRHNTGSNETPAYYYTFTIEEVLYFTYGGPAPTKDGQHFTSWKLLSGGTGFTVTDNAVFTAQFQAEKSYVFNVYFYYEDGTRAKDTFAVTKSETDVTPERKLTFTVDNFKIPYYAANLKQEDGVTWNADGTVTVDVDAVFGAENTSATNFLALTMLYTPEEISYTIEYYQEPVNATDPKQYVKVGSTASQKIAYGTRIPVVDRPDLDGKVSFDGFLVSEKSRFAVTEGVVLREDTPNVTFDESGNATVEVYYDRASYFIYLQTGTPEVEIVPDKVQYGEALPNFQEYSDKLSRAGYKEVTENDITLYRLNEKGELVAAENLGDTMPAYDLYAVVKWTPDTTSLRLVYWVESRNAASFQNAYTATVDNVATEAMLTVSLAGGVTISGDGWPGGTDGKTVVAEQFKELMKNRYGSDDYATFFSYSAEQTKASPGNTANAQATGTGNVTGSAITDDSYKVKVNGDGTTTINIYYTRNLYTLEFVLARENFNQIEIATNTPGTFAGASWTPTGEDSGSFGFADFSDQNVVAQAASSGETYGALTVIKSYYLKEAQTRDARSAVGRYGTKKINGYTCRVYTLTARFEANISSLWPTVDNINTAYGKRQYISMGTDADSYYRNVVTQGSGQHNILNVYSTMDLNVVAQVTAENEWKAEPDTGNGTVTHQMVAYWYQGATKYSYYSLYEVLDTTVLPNSSGVTEFSAADADAGKYQEGQKLSWNGKVYVYTKTYDTQYSTFEKSGQNQPSRQGFISSGKDYAGNDEKEESNIYFFYTRETYTLDIQNVNGRYEVPEALLTTKFDCLSQYEDNAQTLQQLGWEKVNTDGTVSVRYGAPLTPLDEEDIVTWLTNPEGGNLQYPIQSAGESQYHFRHWYRNATQTVPIDWENDNDVKTMASNTTLYVGWFSPRYTTTYVLNGGTWTDKIDYTLTTTVTDDNHNVYIYYPHQAEKDTDPLYWYIQTREDDRLFVDTLYVCEVGDVAHRDETNEHWELNEGLTVEKMLTVSEEDLKGKRLVDHNFCYMGQGAQYNHEKYININSIVNTVLAQPQTPERTGYTFQGWFYFDEVPENGQKTYLKDVLNETQSMASYDANYVYLDHVGDAFLLHKDEAGELFYYEEQTGYRFSYANGASVVTRDRQLYAAWDPNGDAKGVVYHLVKEADITGENTFTPRGEATSVSVDATKTITIGDERYYILKEEALPSLYTGSTYTQTAWEYCADDAGKKWLPEEASIDLHADSRTQTVNGPEKVKEGNTYRVENENGTFTYYAYFVYEPTNEVVYNVYAIDLSVAVAEGDLDSYQDTFDRSFQVNTTEPYFLGSEKKSVTVDDDLTSTVVTENAPAINGYTVYQDWSQSLQLQTDTTANNIFFYYVRDSATISYDITFYPMTNGRYSSENRVTISNIPAVTGEIISLDDLATTYEQLLTMAQTYSTYAGSTNKAQQSLYDRYKAMTVTLIKNGTSTRFTVDSNDENTLELTSITGLPQDYYVDGWTPTGNSLVVSNNVTVEVYLATAELVVQKVDTSRLPLAGATFTLERLMEDNAGEISYNGKTYIVDPSFQTVTAVSGQDGKAIFHDLSARIFEDGKGYLYRLTETQAPKGYNCLAEPLYVTTPYTVGDEVSYSVTYTVVNTGIAYLPQTGVFGGVYTTIFLGIGLMAVSAGCGILWLRRRKSCPPSQEESPADDVEP